MFDIKHKSILYSNTYRILRCKAFNFFFLPTEVSRDCTHPSLKGQSEKNHFRFSISRASNFKCFSYLGNRRKCQVCDLFEVEVDYFHNDTTYLFSH